MLRSLPAAYKKSGIVGKMVMTEGGIIADAPPMTPAVSDPSQPKMDILATFTGGRRPLRIIFVDSQPNRKKCSYATA